MARKETSNTSSFADLVARLKEMSNVTPEQERNNLMEAARQEPKILDEKDVSLADIAKLAGIKEYVEPIKVSEKAEKLVESITAENKDESAISKAIKESDADDSLSTNIKKAVTEESKRLDKIAELEAQLAELKSAEKQDATMDDKAFREMFMKEMTEYVKEAEANDLVELYNTFSQNEVEMNEDNFLVKTPETQQVIADAEKAEAPEEEVVQEKDAEKDEKEDEEDEEDEEDDTAGEVPMLDKDFDEGEDVELGQKDEFTNDLDPQK